MSAPRSLRTLATISCSERPGPAFAEGISLPISCEEWFAIQRALESLSEKRTIEFSTVSDPTSFNVDANSGVEESPQTAPAEGLTAAEIEQLRVSCKQGARNPAFPPIVDRLCDMALRGLVPQGSPEPKLASEEMISVAYAMSIPCAGCGKTALDFVEGAQASDGQGASADTGRIRRSDLGPRTQAAQSEVHPTPPQGSGERREEECSYCEVNYPWPVSYHHSEEECAANIARADPEPARMAGFDPAALTAASAQSAAGEEAIFWAIRIQGGSASTMPPSQYAEFHPDRVYVSKEFAEGSHWMEPYFDGDRSEHNRRKASIVPLYARPAPPAVEWISVEERRPGEEPVLLTDGSDVLTGFYGKSWSSTKRTEVEGWFGHNLGYDGSSDIFHATHWQPLPAAPRAKEGA